jgi:NADPH:quinone reductase-like Zn-dependent oxidoreductase
LKAAVFRSPGEPDVLTFDDVVDPVAGPGEALIRVKACGVNRIDIWARNGRYKTNLPHILGTDVAGEVVSISDSNAGISEGDLVVVYPVLSDGKCAYCLRGMPNLCVSRGFVGVATDGGYAEYVKVPSANLIPAKGIDPKVAAAMPVDFGTAWSGLVSRAKAGHGDTVLVWGAAGGLGHAAIQIAKLLGASVIAAVGDDRKTRFVQSMGADHVVNYRSQDIAGSVRALTGGQGASVVFDHVGGDTWGKSIDCLSRGGRLVTLGLTSGPKSEVDVRRVYSDELSIVGTYGQLQSDIQKVLGLAAEGKLKPAIHRELPLASAREAHLILESRDVQGKLLLLP